ncbi:GntR family transcriptional regulator [Nocardioides sp. Root190]|uniref:FadR/GntR family transcriptional regulator n=1 Tax=Nocardioides sp. Root190 TaxID=1736488 RepID=UPI0006FB0701|nr:FCD domain-containing protein [Nocardioides sp. Root190]KRB78475.1 GntR family transcriptional regulator [Nocardioides sp. Root190]
MTPSPHLGPVRQIAAHELVVDELRRSLDQGQFRPGDRLPSERELAEILCVSRTTVRSAVSVLEAERRLSVRRGRGGGFTVLAPPHDQRATGERAQTGLRALRDLFDLRLVVETGAVQLAAARRTAEDLTDLENLLGRMQQVIREERRRPSTALVYEFQALDNRFHLDLARCSRNAHLVAQVAAARGAMWGPVGSVFRNLEPNANDLHADILAAVRTGAGERASSLMADHIDDTHRTLASWLTDS